MFSLPLLVNYSSINGSDHQHTKDTPFSHTIPGTLLRYTFYEMVVGRSMKNRAIIIGIVLLVALTLQLSIADTWTSKASMATTRRFPGMAVVGGKLYVIGGDGVRVTEEFDPVANSWATMDSMPTIRWWGFGTGAVNGKIYALGGASGGVYLDVNEEFDPSTNSWTSRTIMPTERHGLAVGVINDTIYAVGGRNSGGYLAVNEAYDPTTDTWTTKTPMPTARYYLTVAVANGKLYAIGGHGAAGNLTTVEEYDPVTDSWTSRTGMPTAREELAAATLNGKIYTVGGWSGAADLPTNEEYDPILDSWTPRAAMITARSGLAAASVADSLYAVGGLLGFTYLSVNEMYYFDPVHISSPSFQAQATEWCVDLKWAVSMEEDCQCYIIARKSLPGSIFDEKARIPGSGFSSSPKTYRYSDRDVSPGARYLYRLGIVRSNGDTEWTCSCSADIPFRTSAVHITPNPVHGSASIHFTTPRTEKVCISIYDSAGNHIKTLFDGILMQGTHTFRWEGTSTNTMSPSGVYFCTASSGKNTVVRKILVVK